MSGINSLLQSGNLSRYSTQAANMQDALGVLTNLGSINVVEVVKGAIFGDDTDFFTPADSPNIGGRDIQATLRAINKHKEKQRSFHLGATIRDFFSPQIIRNLPNKFKALALAYEGFGAFKNILKGDFLEAFESITGMMPTSKKHKASMKKEKLKAEAFSIHKQMKTATGANKARLRKQYQNKVSSALAAQAEERWYIDNPASDRLKIDPKQLGTKAGKLLHQDGFLGKMLTSFNQARTTGIG